MNNISKISSASFIIALLFLLVKVFGFLEKVVLANYFGTSDAVDAYLVAFSIPFALYIIIEEIVNPVLVPYFVDKFGNRNKQSGIIIFKRILFVLSLILIIISVLGSFYAGTIINYMAPGFEGEKQNMAVGLLEISFVMLLFLGLSSLFTTVFHAYKKFNLPVIGRAIEKLFIIIGIILLHKMYGIYSAIIGCVIGALMKVVLLWVFMPDNRRIIQKQIRKKIPQGEYKYLLLLMFPLFCGVIFSQVSGLVDNYVASKLQSGSIAAISYARKIIDLPILIVPYAMGIVLLPYLSLLSKPEKHKDFVELLEKCLKFLILGFVFLTVMTLILKTSIIKILFERGKFDGSSTYFTSTALFWFAFGLVIFAVEIPIMQSYFALKDTKTPIVIGIICAVINIVITLTVVKWVGFIIIPIALVVQKTLKINVLLTLLKRKIDISLKNIYLFSVRIILCGTLTYIILKIIISYTPILEAHGFIQQCIGMSFGSIIGLFLFSGFLWIFNIQEIHDITIASKNLFQRGFSFVTNRIS